MTDRLAAFFAGQAPALRSAFATTLACEIALVIVMTLHLPNPAWALITVFVLAVLATPTAAASIQKGVLRICGTLVGAALAVALIAWFDQFPVAFSLALFAICVVAAYGATSARHPYAYLIGLVTIVIVAMDSLAAPERTVHLAFARAAEVGVGVVTSVLVRLSVWPQRASAKLRAELATTLALSGPLVRGDVTDDRDAAVVALIRSRQQQQVLLATTGGEGDLTRAQELRYAHAVAAVSAIIRHVLAAEAIAGAAGGMILVELRSALARVTDDLAQALRRERLRGGEALARALDALRTPITTAAATSDALTAALARVLLALTDELRALARLADYLGPGATEAPAEVDVAARVASQPARRAWVDRPRLMHALKVALVVEVALWLWMVFHLPGGMQGMVSAVIIAQRTVGATLLKGRLRLLGAVIGGVLGILVASFAIPGVSSLGVFCLVTAPVLFASAWLNDGSPRWGYVGFQTGFAFILTLVAGSSPVPDALAPVLRICGVLIGVVVAWVVMQAAAPVDAWRESLRGLGAILASIGRGLSGADAQVATAERMALRDETVAYMSELPAGTARWSWSRRSLDQLLALGSCLGAVVGRLDVATVAPGGRSGLHDAARHLASAAHRLAKDMTARRMTAPGGELAAAIAALQRAAGGGASVSPDVLAQIGYLQTAAVLLGAIDRVVAAAHPPAAARLQPVPAVA